ncbi:hypothetical protein ASC97_23205 [Rhizobium sp. Root1203]|nr:hypothetical protein ASC97_23205 [Rhizobium sp. Root1203]
MNELASADINFTETGVGFREWPPSPYVPTGMRQNLPKPAPAKIGDRDKVKLPPLRRRES